MWPSRRGGGRGEASVQLVCQGCRHITATTPLLPSTYISGLWSPLVGPRTALHTQCRPRQWPQSQPNIENRYSVEGQPVKCDVYCCCCKLWGGLNRLNKGQKGRLVCHQTAWGQQDRDELGWHGQGAGLLGAGQQHQLWQPHRHQVERGHLKQSNSYE